MSQLRTVQVLGGGAGSSAHVTSLTTGLVARGVRVTVCAPADGARAPAFPVAGAHFTPVPGRGGPATVTALRAACADADVVHAHGPHAAVRAGLALSGRGTPLVMTWHPRAHAAEGVRRRMLHLVERRAARAAAVVLATSSELVDRARIRGARDARLASTALPAGPRPAVNAGKARAELGAVGRPLLVSAGTAAPYRGDGTLLDAVRLWRGLDPAPLLVVVGEGSDEEALRRRVMDEGLPVVLTGRREDLGQLLTVADLAVLPGREEARPMLAGEALRLGVPLVAADTRGLRELVGGAAELVPYGDAGALAGAVVRLLGDPGRRKRLAEAGRLRAAGWPTEEDTVAHVLSVYDELARPLSAAGRG
ncbi:glycosyltransferase family 4 protein [Streptomyces sp. NBC_01754]|uniref:glycosyltransferase family 4 protein n=1 Tax=Streptomyces sp. NBC_01754 TaxID=2975930 RepID=UPI002DD7D0B5|nr:glycosyltransferase family 4 protein [Streptomyces sp. NBC_01754]WSC91747.1 glycosyltransferase family 4 protein [Streptomyces sp. NBC_01754]